MNKYRTLYKALPFCIEDKENQDILEKENIYKTYTYKSNFANIVLSDDNEEFFNAKEKQIINLLYDEECKSLYLANQNSEIQATFNPMSSTIYIDTQTKELYLFANDKDFIDCDTIYEQIKQELKLQESIEELQSYKPSLFFYSTLLLGSSEIETNPFFFGTPDTKSNIGLDESKPIYHFSPKDEENNLGTLTIFLNSCTLTILNYSLLDSTLNIKLTLTNKESKEKQQQAKAKTKQQTQPEQLKPLSLAMLHPILEDNEIKCPHNGVVQLKSNKGKSITDKNIPFILESDLLNSPIIGCTNNIAGVPTPCTQVALILPHSRGLKKHNGDYPIMQDLVSSGVMSDKGFPLICTPKPNSYKINAPSPTHTKNRDKEALKTQIEFHKPILRLHYKIYPSQKDNLPIYRIKLDDSIIESNNDTPLDALNIDIAKDTKTLDTGTLNDSSLDSNLQDILSKIYSSLKQTYAKDYLYQYLSLQLDSNVLILILLIPQRIPKVYKEPYKNYEHKDYGIGKYNYLYEYCTFTTLKIADSMQAGLDSYPSNATILTLHTPYKAQRLELQLASGLDSVIESDREQTQQIIDSLLTLQVINGGYEEKHWGFREETENKDTQANPVQTNINTESKDSKATQENKDKQILEMYFSYGEDMTRLQGDSRHSSDVNLHIITQGYNNGEEVEVELGTRTQKIIVNGKVNNNEVVIQDIESKFKRK
ncbi:lipase [Helicobacter fennelliae]|uniref:lipase n=1 Tax=Helicobacter fennelliae TaxID=215 RepID=UPI000DFD8AF1|nr:lipase [Helicobacter fennelliae]STQ92013.1 lipase family protein [Helicobacter fennelliae]